MSKELLIDKIYRYLKENDLEHEYTKVQIKKIYETFINLIVKELEEESKKVNKDNKNVDVLVPLLGKLVISYRPLTINRNPKTGEKVKTPEGKRIYYSPSKKIKNSVKK